MGEALLSSVDLTHPCFHRFIFQDADAAFPPASVEIVSRISNALFNYAPFYSAVLSLMKEMRLPAPFGDHPNIGADLFSPPKHVLQQFFGYFMACVSLASILAIVI